MCLNRFTIFSWHRNIASNSLVDDVHAAITNVHEVHANAAGVAPFPYLRNVMRQVSDSAMGCIFLEESFNSSVLMLISKVKSIFKTLLPYKLFILWGTL